MRFLLVRRNKEFSELSLAESDSDTEQPASDESRSPSDTPPPPLKFKPRRNHQPSKEEQAMKEVLKAVGLGNLDGKQREGPSVPVWQKRLRNVKGIETNSKRPSTSTKIKLEREQPMKDSFKPVSPPVPVQTVAFDTTTSFDESCLSHPSVQAIPPEAPPAPIKKTGYRLAQIPSSLSDVSSTVSDFFRRVVKDEEVFSLATPSYTSDTDMSGDNSLIRKVIRAGVSSVGGMSSISSYPMPIRRKSRRAKKDKDLGNKDLGGCSGVLTQEFDALADYLLSDSPCARFLQKVTEDDEEEEEEEAEGQEEVVSPPRGRSRKPRRRAKRHA